MIIYGYITNKLNKKRIEDISINKAHTILKIKIYALNHYLHMVT